MSESSDGGRGKEKFSVNVVLPGPGDDGKGDVAPEIRRS